MRDDPRAVHMRLRREAVFALPDRRGNAPNLTRESPEAEGMRLNAQRYETVEQMEMDLDHRDHRYRDQRGLGDVAPVNVQQANAGLGLLGALALMAVGAIGYALLTRKSEDVPEDESATGYIPQHLRENPSAPAQVSPAASSASPIVVVPSPAPLALPPSMSDKPVTEVTSTTETRVIVEPRKRRRSLT